MTDTSPWASAPLDREIVISRVINAAQQRVFDAWADPAQIVKWFGPEGFEIVSHEADIREGGLWRFDMIAPDGTRFTNRMRFVRIEAPRLIEVEHGSDQDDDPDRFHMLVTFDAQDNGKTVITLRQMHPTAARRGIVIGFGAVEFGGQTLGELAAHCEG